MKILIRAVGKIRDRRLGSLCEEYAERVQRHLPFQIDEVDDDDALVRGLPPGADIVALEPGGDAWTTDGFAKYLGKHMVQGTRAVVFLIGGADGLSAAIVKQAQRRLSLSPLTLPHRLARVVLCEQIYRAISIIRGEPYSR